ncbi:hypothetical protein SMD44_05109 [Streptomyces alboflavus]|uniref:Uncharacterized protein n=1 Tax=Streptomyces alboflavus TaxID=67267 RepID=A0A1Z1WGR8_9ACTN|nr:hypothetical protein [Streptomyces alboflavus]ARX85645.1 hypothetical protein SMD44_05109 [Streptomyces alboflavus]
MQSTGSRTRYHVGFNKPGEAPEYRVECIGDLDEARGWLNDDIGNVADDYYDEGALPFVEFLDRDEEHNDVGVHRIGDYEFWIKEVTDCKCPCSCDVRGEECDGEHRREALPHLEPRERGHVFERCGRTYYVYEQIDAWRVMEWFDDESIEAELLVIDARSREEAVFGAVGLIDARNHHNED